MDQINKIISNANKVTSEEIIEFEQSLGSDVSEIHHTNLPTNAQDFLNNEHMIEDEGEVAVYYSQLTERPDCDEKINSITTEKAIKVASQVLISKKNDNHDQNQDEKVH